MTRRFSKDEFFRFIKFGVTGVMNTLVDFTVFWVLSYLGINQFSSQVVSYSCGMFNSYIVNRSWTFNSKNKFFSRQMLRFIVANLSLLLLSLGVLLILDKMGYAKLIAKLCATAVTMVVGFLLNRLWVFSAK